MANHACRASGFEFFGKSRIIDFYGNLLAIGSEGLNDEEFLVAEIDADEMASNPMS